MIAAHQLISALSVSGKLVYHFRFLVHCWLACFSNTRFTPPFVLQVAPAGKSHSRIEILAVLILKKFLNKLASKQKTPASEEQRYSATFTVVTIYKAEHPLPLVLLEQPANVHWFAVNMSVSHTYQEPPPQVQLLPIIAQTKSGTKSLGLSLPLIPPPKFITCGTRKGAWLEGLWIKLPVIHTWHTYLHFHISFLFSVL